MSSPRTDPATSSGEYDDAYKCLLEQPAPQLHENSIDSPQNDEQMALTLHDSNQDLEAEKLAHLELNGGETVPAILDSGSAGLLQELNRKPTEAGSTDRSGFLFGSPHNISSHNPRAKSQQVLAIQCTKGSARAPSNYIHTTSRAVARSQLQYPNKLATTTLNFKHKPLDHQQHADSVEDTSLAATACKVFEEQMVRMPAEICQMLMDMVFEGAFGPRRVHPHEDPPIMNVFLAMDKQFYLKYHGLYWTENTWVVSKGPLNKTMRFMTEKPYNEATTDFSLQTPNKAAMQIRSVELSFSNADTPNLSEWRQLAGQNAAPYGTPSYLHPQAPYDVQTLQIAQRSIARMNRVQRYDDIQNQLIQTWQDKFDRVAMLHLRHLTLDFTEAYEPGGLYLGVYIVRRLIPFAYGIPADFKILAPDSWTERQIRDAFLVLNAI